MGQHPFGKRVVTLVALLLVVGVGALTACAGKTSSTSSSSASSSGSPGDDAGTSRDVPIGCPSTLPWTRTTANGPENPCPKEGQVCEYGTDFEPSCNKIVRCDSGGWAVPLYGGGGGKNCGSQPPKIPPNPADCPASK